MLLKELKGEKSYIFVTLPFTQDIPAVSVQHAVEEIAGMPEFSISQSVAAKAIVKSAHKRNTMNPVLGFARGRETRAA
jgi:hypothetical protein